MPEGRGARILWPMPALRLSSLPLGVFSVSFVLASCIGDAPSGGAQDAAPAPTGTTSQDSSPPPVGADGAPAPDVQVPDSAPGDSASDVAADTASTRHYVFVTDAKVDGGFAGFTDPWVAADLTCATEARANGLPGTFVAWISYETATGTKFNASSRISDVAYYLPGTPDGGPPVLVAASKADLLTQGALVQMDRTGSGAQVDYDENTAVAWVWTGSDSKGTASSSGSCLRWTSAASSEFGGTGNARRIPAFTPFDWTSLGNRPCNIKRRFYCFQK